jgi:hypothetical protein
MKLGFYWVKWDEDGRWEPGELVEIEPKEGAGDDWHAIGETEDRIPFAIGPEIVRED